MYTEEDMIKKIEIDYINKHVRVIKDRVVKKDGVVVGGVDEMRNNSRSFDPGAIEEVKAHIKKQSGPEIDLINSLWTPEVIANHRAKIEAMER